MREKYNIVHEVHPSLAGFMWFDGGKNVGRLECINRA